jgi:large subunit ribosomal protein L30e
MSDIEEIRKNLKSNKLIIGTEETVKELKLGRLNKVFLASNCNPAVRKDIEHYAKLGGTELVLLDIPNDELGVACRKTFFISVLSMLK